MSNHPKINKIAFIGNYLPRQCGIATFTTDLCESMSLQFPDIQCFAIPVTDIPEGYDYPERVRFEIKEQDLDSYKRAADFLNINNPGVVSLQHEYGIFGGPAGSYILTILRQLRMPVVTTLHTVLNKPNQQQYKVMEELIDLSDYVVVMNKKAVNLLTAIYKASDTKIRLIPHGIPDVPFIDPNFYKDQFGVEGKTVLLTFGLLSPRKGIEVALQALPEVIKEFPNIVYIILGVTHPNLVRQEGEAYRLNLQRLAEDLAIIKNVIFYNRFVTTEELKEFIVIADIYITPYLTEDQITSGTLAYSFGAGNAVISTPFWHATELLGDGKGILVPFGDPAAISKEIIRLLRNETERHALRKNAYLLGREMVWSNIAKLYKQTFEDARLKRPSIQTQKSVIRSLDRQKPELPKIRLDHLLRMTDSVGILQHAIYTVPNLAEGYCTDDNARALILIVLLEELGETDLTQLTDLGTIYLAFLNYAFDTQTRRFKNFMDFNRQWMNKPASEDCHGRALWALGTCLGRSSNPGFRNIAGQLFELALSVTEEFTSPRAWAFILTGIHEYLRRFEGDRLVNHIREQFAGKLFHLYQANQDDTWAWFEQSVTYCNAKLSHALILSGRWTSNQPMLEAGLRSLRWLASTQTSLKNHFRPIGSNGFYHRGGTIAAADQQPVEAQAMISACLEAYRTTKDQTWYAEAYKAFQWFLGSNDLSLPLYDTKTGGCRDALHVDRLNQNEGAESSVAFYLSLVEMIAMKNTVESLKEPLSV